MTLKKSKAASWCEQPISGNRVPSCPWRPRIRAIRQHFRILCRHFELNFRAIALFYYETTIDSPPLIYYVLSDSYLDKNRSSAPFSELMGSKDPGFLAAQILRLGGIGCSNLALGSEVTYWHWSRSLWCCRRCWRHGLLLKWKYVYRYLAHILYRYLRRAIRSYDCAPKNSRDALLRATFKLTNEYSQQREMQMHACPFLASQCEKWGRCNDSRQWIQRVDPPVSPDDGPASMSACQVDDRQHQLIRVAQVACAWLHRGLNISTNYVRSNESLVQKRPIDSDVVRS